MGERTYDGVVGAFPYALGRSESRLLRLYAVVGGVLAALLAVFFAFALVTAVADSLGGGTISGYPALVILLALSVVLPVMGPVLLVARRHRRAAETGARPPSVGYERLMGTLGFVFLLSVYVGLVISVPESYQSPTSGALAPVARALYDAPAVVSPLPPLAVALTMLVLDRLFGRPDGTGGESEGEGEGGRSDREPESPT